MLVITTIVLAVLALNVALYLAARPGRRIRKIEIQHRKARLWSRMQADAEKAERERMEKQKRIGPVPDPHRTGRAGCERNAAMRGRRLASFVARLAFIMFADFRIYRRNQGGVWYLVRLFSSQPIEVWRRERGKGIWEKTVRMEIWYRGEEIRVEMVEGIGSAEGEA